jgi:dGTP triphosphohydrolase
MRRINRSEKLKPIKAKGAKVITTFEYYDEDDNVVERKVEETIMDNVFQAMKWMHGITRWSDAREVADGKYVAYMDDGYGMDIYGKITYEIVEA